GRRNRARGLQGAVDPGPRGLPDRAPRTGLRARESRHLSDPDRRAEPDARDEEQATRALELRRHVPDVPAASRTPAHAGGRAVGWRAADADAVPDADGRPRADHDRRADRGARAEDRRTGRRVPERTEEPRHL